jgi:hypothetical protein
VVAVAQRRVERLTVGAAGDTDVVRSVLREVLDLVGEAGLEAGDPHLGAEEGLHGVVVGAGGH